MQFPAKLEKHKEVAVIVGFKRGSRLWVARFISWVTLKKKSRRVVLSRRGEICCIPTDEVLQSRDCCVHL